VSAPREAPAVPTSWPVVTRRASSGPLDVEGAALTFAQMILAVSHEAVAEGQLQGVIVAGTWATALVTLVGTARAQEAFQAAARQAERREDSERSRARQP
jgi:hypothetical protein